MKQPVLEIGAAVACPSDGLLLDGLFDEDSRLPCWPPLGLEKYSKPKQDRAVESAGCFWRLTCLQN